MLEMKMGSYFNDFSHIFNNVLEIESLFVSLGECMSDVCEIQVKSQLMIEKIGMIVIDSKN